jgi:hypothetical protein
MTISATHNTAMTVVRRERPSGFTSRRGTLVSLISGDTALDFDEPRFFPERSLARATIYSHPRKARIIDCTYPWRQRVPACTPHDRLVHRAFWHAPTLLQTSPALVSWPARWKLELVAGRSAHRLTVGRKVQRSACPWIAAPRAQIVQFRHCTGQQSPARCSDPRRRLRRQHQSTGSQLCSPSATRTQIRASSRFSR